MIIIILKARVAVWQTNGMMTAGTKETRFAQFMYEVFSLKVKM